MVHKSKSHEPSPKHPEPSVSSRKAFAQAHKPILALVLKSDTDGCERAIREIIAHADESVPIEIIHHGVGDICKTDIMAAATGSRLVLGFNVNVLPRIAELCAEQNVEIRLYSIIYKLQEDLNKIAQSLVPQAVDEKILGQAKVIALFKSSRKGIIIGCEVEDGRLQLGDTFRIISAMGPVYAGKITSMHIEKNNVSKATAGYQLGVKIIDFQGVRVGDLVESYQIGSDRKSMNWRPSGKIMRL